LPDLPAAGSPATAAARDAISHVVQRSCAVTLAEALDLQADLAADFLASKLCARGVVGTEYKKTMKV
jgi:hypothetical protein